MSKFSHWYLRLINFNNVDDIKSYFYFKFQIWGWISWNKHFSVCFFFLDNEVASIFITPISAIFSFITFFVQRDTATIPTCKLVFRVALLRQNIISLIKTVFLQKNICSVPYIGKSHLTRYSSNLRNETKRVLIKYTPVFLITALDGY